MIRINILYPTGGHFDMGYYLNTHMPRSIELMSQGKGYRGVSVERGLGGTIPDAEPAFVALCQFAFDSIDDFMAAFLPHADELKGDMANYTDIEPIIQFSEIEIGITD